MLPLSFSPLLLELPCSTLGPYTTFKHANVNTLNKSNYMKSIESMEKRNFLMSLKDNLFLGSMEKAPTRWNLANHKLTKAPQKKGENKEQNGRTKTTNEPPKRANRNGNIKFSNPNMSQEAYQLKKEEEDPLKDAYPRWTLIYYSSTSQNRNCMCML